MYFNANINVFITNDKNEVARLETVMSAKVRNESTQLGSYCEVVVPLISRLQFSDGKYLTEQSKNLFKQGYKISVESFYTLKEQELVDEYPILNIFDGYILDFVEGNPLTIKCVDELYNLNFTKNINIDSKAGTGKLKDIIDKILENTGVTQLTGTFDLDLVGMTFANMTPAACLDHLKKELGINISLQGKQLYVALASNTLDTFKLDTSVNVIESNITKKETTFQKIRLKAWFIKSNGTKDSFEVGDEGGQSREVFFYKVKIGALKAIQTADGTMKQVPVAYYDLANEALAKCKMNMYTGTVKTKLYPKIPLYAYVIYKDVRYPDRSGTYVCTSADCELNPSGFNWTYKLAQIDETSRKTVNGKPLNSVK